MSCRAPAGARTGERRNGPCLGDIQGRNLFMCPAGDMPWDTQPCWGVFDRGGCWGNPGEQQGELSCAGSVRARLPLALIL